VRSSLHSTSALAFSHSYSLLALPCLFLNKAVSLHPKPGAYYHWESAFHPILIN